MNNDRKEFVFFWLIENYSYLWHRNNEKISSPVFIVDTLESTSWMLHLYPRGDREEDKDYISFYLHRSGNCNGPETFTINYELSFLAPDGSTLFSYEFKDISFIRHSTLGSYQFIKTNEVMLKEKDTYLPQGTLTIRCRMWKSQEGKFKTGQSLARTRIAIETISSLETVEKFSELEINQNINFLIRCNAGERSHITINLYLIESSCGEEKIMLEIDPSNHKKRMLSSCSILLIDAAGRNIKCGQADGNVYRTEKSVWKLPLQFTKKFLIERKSEYLLKDKLSLLCEFTFSKRLDINRIEMTNYGIPIASTIPLHNTFDFSGACFIENKLSDSPTCKDDFKAFYENQTLSDVQLKTKTKVFCAHKTVLSARSIVFRAMFTYEMTEKNTNCIDLDDVEDDICDRFLLFLYTDILEDLQWETAIKLYYVADKYEIKRLKLKCSSFLIDNIKVSNAIDVLRLSDIHQDSDLKKVVTSFILRHQMEIFSSEEWQIFAKTNSELALDTMFLTYTKKET